VNVAVLCFHALGGSGVVAGEIGRALAARGHRVHVVGAALPGRLEAVSGVELHKVPLEAAPPVGPQAFPVALAAGLIELAQSERLDVVHAHYALPHAVAASLARQVLGPQGPRLVVSLHGTDVPPPEAGEPLAQLVRQAVLDADAVTAPSRALAAQARERLRLPGSLPVQVFPNFVDAARFRPAGQPDRSALSHLFPEMALDWDQVRVICHASNFRPVKRPLDVVRIFARIAQQRPAVLVLAGDGPERAHVEAEAHLLGVQRAVAFPGAVRELQPLLRASDLFLLPSTSESFGLAALEAMSCGVPVIASLTGGLPEVVGPGEGGLLFPVGHVDAMADAALRLLGDPDEHARLSRGARERAVRLFQPGPIIDRWEALYERIQHQGSRRLMADG
jgi:N-acetyl-alpha-D-glucosaminyl L-malate synthase BshA